MIKSLGDGLLSGSPAKYDPLSSVPTEDEFDDEFLILEKSDFFLPSGRSSDSESSDVGPLQNVKRFLYPEIDKVEDLHPEQVRWFYKDPGDKKWTPFIGYDSLRIECQYRESLHRKEKEDGSVEPAEVKTERIDVRGGIYEVDVDAMLCFSIYWTNKGEDSQIMRGTWFIDGTWQPLEDKYSVGIEKEHLTFFWGHKLPSEKPDPKAAIPVMHHIKFKEFHIDWNAADRVYLFSEAKSSKLYRAVGHKLGLSKSGTQVHRGYCFEATMEDKPSDISHLVFVIHGIGQIMETSSIVKSCTVIRDMTQKLKKKYMTDNDEVNSRAEFLPVEWRSSLRLDGDTVESITPNKVRGLRQVLNASAMDILYYTSPLYRSEITDGLQTELNRLYKVFCERHPYFEATGGKVSILAHSLGCVIMYDILTGWNPIRLYDQYVARVIDHEIQSCSQATEQNNQTEEATELLRELEKARKRVSDLEADVLAAVQKQQLKSSTLKFKVENFFCLGSPLAVFLALRGVRPKGNGTQDHILPRSLCKRLFNIYHPSDPVAYRLEPLILKHYSTIGPLHIHRVVSTKKLPYEKMKPVAYSAVLPTSKSNQSDLAKSGSCNSLHSNDSAASDEKKQVPAITKTDTTISNEPTEEKISKGRFSKMLWSWKKDDPDVLTTEMAEIQTDNKVLKLEDLDAAGDGCNGIGKDDGADEEDSNSLENNNESPIDDTELEFRLDYQLKQGKMENAYISAITSHTSYWMNQDVNLFVTSHLFPNSQVT